MTRGSASGARGEVPNRGTGRTSPCFWFNCHGRNDRYYRHRGKIRPLLVANDPLSGSRVSGVKPMLFRRACRRLVLLGVLLAWAVPAAAEDYYIGDVQPFAKFDMSLYDRRPWNNEGFFFSLDYLEWWMSSPESAVIGNPNVNPLVQDPPFPGGVLRPAINSLDTSFFEAARHSGQLIEFGYIEGDRGWMARSLDLNNTRQRIANGTTEISLADPNNFISQFVDFDANGFDDDLDGDGIYGRHGLDTDSPPDGEPDVPAPVDFDDTIRPVVVFNSLTAVLETEFWTAEFNWLHRYPRAHYGGFWETFWGLRYINFDEEFVIDGTGGVLSKLKLANAAENNTVAIQFGASWMKQARRWRFRMDGRLVFGLNFQRIRQRVTFMDQSIRSVVPPDGGGGGGGNEPPDLGTSLVGISADSVSDSWAKVEFVPMLEVGFTYSYYLTRYISVRAGWRGFVLDGVARPTSMINYTFPQFGILRDNNRQYLFAHGVTFGFDINR